MGKNIKTLSDICDFNSLNERQRNKITTIKSGVNGKGIGSDPFHLIEISQGRNDVAPDEKQSKEENLNKQSQPTNCLHSVFNWDVNIRSISIGLPVS